MDDILLLEAIENYLTGKMNAEEKAYFEQLRKNTPEIDQMVVEHTMFLQQMDVYSAHRNLKHSLHETHVKLLENGGIAANPSKNTKTKVMQLWTKYKRVTTIAASVGGVIALVISVIITSLTPKIDEGQLEQLSKDVAILKQNDKNQNKAINEVASKIPQGAILTGGGSGFLIDAKGYMVTNAHVVKGSSAVVVNNKGQEFNAVIAYRDVTRDLAILKIDDKDFKAPAALPYNLRKADADLGEEIYTLGYPRNDEIVYNMGYLSARSGFNGDTITCQISLSANPGNSGGPVLNKNGEIIGMLSTRETTAQGVVFAIKTKNIYRLVEELKDSDTSFQKIKLSSSSNLKNKDRVQQIKLMENYVYQVKAFNR